MEHGIVTSTTYKDGVVYCNVRAIRVDTEYRNVPVLKPHSGFIQRPEQGMKVAIDKLDDDTRFIQSVMTKDDSYPSSMEEGELVIQLDGGTEVSLEKKQNGNYDLHLSASGDVFIDGIDFDDHSHEYEDDNGTTTSTKTTGPPKN